MIILNPYRLTAPPAVNAVIEWTDGTVGNLVTLANATAGIRGAALTVSIHTYSPPTGVVTPQHTKRVNGIPPRRIPVSCAGATYAGSSGDGVMFDMDAALAGSGKHEGINFTLPGGVSVRDLTVSFLVKYNPAIGTTSGFSTDTGVMEANGAYATLQTNYTTALGILSRVETQDNGGQTKRGRSRALVANTWYLATFRLSGTDGRSYNVWEDMQGNVVAASARHTDYTTGSNPIIYFGIQDYLFPSGQNPAGTITIGQIEAAWTNQTFPLQPVNVPAPTTVVAAQINTGTIQLTWEGNGLSYLVEQLYLGSWTTLAADQIQDDRLTNSIDSLTVSSLVNGGVYQFRVTAKVGGSSSISVASNVATITDTIPTGTLWQSQTLDDTGVFDGRYLSNPATGSVLAQKIKGINASAVTPTKITLKAGNVTSAGTMQLRLCANADGTGTVYGSSAPVSVSIASPGTPGTEIDFPFYSGSIPPLTDHYIFVIHSGVEVFVRGKTVTNPYPGGGVTGYDEIYNGSALPDGFTNDMWFKFYTV